MSRRTSRTPFRRGVFGLFGGSAIVALWTSTAYSQSQCAMEYIPNVCGFAKTGSNALAKNNSTTHRHRITVAVHVNGNLLNYQSSKSQAGSPTFSGWPCENGTNHISFHVVGF